MWSPLTLTQNPVCYQQNIAEVTVCDVQVLVINDITASAWPPGSLTLWEAWYHVMRTLKGPHGKELMSPAKNLHQMVNHVSKLS